MSVLEQMRDWAEFVQVEKFRQPAGDANARVVGNLRYYVVNYVIVVLTFAALWLVLLGGNVRAGLIWGVIAVIVHAIFHVSDFCFG
jgi:hypothetical protein